MEPKPPKSLKKNRKLTSPDQFTASDTVKDSHNNSEASKSLESVTFNYADDNDIPEDPSSGEFTTSFEPTIIRESSEYVILSKPVGMSVHGGTFVKQQDTVSHWLSQKYGKREEDGGDKEKSKNVASPGISFILI